MVEASPLKSRVTPRSRKKIDEENPADSIKYGQSSVKRLFELTNYIRYIGVALVALLIFIALVFINNTIQLGHFGTPQGNRHHASRGASNGFIRGPFLMEGAMHAVIGSALAILTIEMLRRFALPQVSNTLAWLPIDLSMTSYLAIYAALIVAGLVIAIIGSLFAMRRYLKV